MQIAREMGGYTLGGADLLRRAMGKKKAEEMDMHKSTFAEGAVAKGFAKADAERVFDLMAYFAGYGFNKSHSAAYALITYQTAYLKAHFPVEFVCATLSADKEKTDKVVRTVSEARSMGITVLPPDVNESEANFAVVYDPANTPPVRRAADKPVCMNGKVRDAMGPKIRFGLAGLRGAGEGAIETVFEARRDEDGKALPPFLDLFDFTSRVDLRRVNKGVVEALVQSGAFDSVHQKLEVTRGQAFAAIETAIERGKKIAADRNSGQTSLFGLLEDNDATKALSRPVSEFPRVEPWDTRELLAREKQTLGFYVSGHPLDRYRTELKRFCTASTDTLSDLSDGTNVTVGGSVEGYRERVTKTGNRIAFFSLEDPAGRVEVIVRPRILSTEGLRDVLQSGAPVLVTGTVQYERGGGGPGGGGGGEEEAAQEAKIVLDEVHPLAESLQKKTTRVRVRLSVDKVDRRGLEALRDTLGRYPGKCPVTLELTSPEKWAAIAGIGMSVAPTDGLLASLEKLFGEKVCELR